MLDRPVSPRTSCLEYLKTKDDYINEILPRSMRAQAQVQVPTSNYQRDSSLAELQGPAKIHEKGEREEAEVRKTYTDRMHRSSVEATQEQRQAASTIQRNYRGYKTRREIQGLGLDASSRWDEAIREIQYRRLTTPRPKSQDITNGKAQDAKSNWRHVSGIARHAHNLTPEGGDVPEDGATEKEKKHASKKEREAWKGKMMDLPYFLEMVDLKHRYGSNLRAYHAEWKKSDTHENYFYWLDYGEGRNVEVPNVSRARLEREQVRYLSREERMQYLVVIDKEGRLCWAKNGQRIDTSIEYRDSVEGIVPASSTAKVYREDEIKAISESTSAGQAVKADGVAQRESAQQSSSEGGSISSTGSAASEEDSSLRYPDPPGLNNAKGMSKLKHVSASVVLNRLLRKSTKKNTWIFVADLSMNLYVGIKQSGSFQHSSFIRGSRISAAGLIKVKDGQLRSLSPLSGHYRPPAAAFKHFIQHLKAEHADMSRVSISKAYAVLVGLETYLGTKKRVSTAGDKIKHGVEHIISPEKAEARRESERDKSQSARLEEQRLRELEEHRAINRVVRDVRLKVERMSSRSDSRGGSVASVQQPGVDTGRSGNTRIGEQASLPHRTV